MDARTWIRLAGAGAVAAGLGLSRQRKLHWGATAEEIAGGLPGDDLLAAPSLASTRAVTIEAPAAEVWPWLVQMGQDRGGLYSYDWLESLFGLDFHNAESIVPAWQRLTVGDQIRAAPESAGADAGFTVVELDPGRSIVTLSGEPGDALEQAARRPLAQGGSWAFVLREVDADTCRLLVRLRARFGLPTPAEQLAAKALEPVHFVMERKLLLGIKERAERYRSAPSTA